MAEAICGPGSRARVVGGSGGTRARLADLHAAASAMDRAGTALEDAALGLARLRVSLRAATVDSPATATPAWEALGPLQQPGQGLAWQAQRARDCAASLRSTADLYATTDTAVADVVGARVGFVGTLVGESGPLGWALAAHLAAAGALQLAIQTSALRLLARTPTAPGILLRSLDPDAARAVGGPVGGLAHLVSRRGPLPPPGLPRAAVVQALVPGVAGFIHGAAPGWPRAGTDPVPRVARVLAAGAQVATGLLGTPTRGVVVTPVVMPPPRQGTAGRTPVPRTTADVLRQVHSLYPGAGGQAGSVAVQRLDHRDGSRSWVVAVPGTQEWSPIAGANPMDLQTNLAAVAAQPQDASEAVVQAMSMAGVAPGEPVLLAGHSQGGIVAMDLARDPHVQERFSVTAVVTAGSPVGGGSGTLPPGTQALHLEHSLDYVPALEGRPNPDDPQRTTVTVDLPLPTSLALGEVPLAAHSMEAYTGTAERLEGLDHPSLRTFDSVLARVLGDGSATARTQRYVGVRMP